MSYPALRLKNVEDESYKPFVPDHVPKDHLSLTEQASFVMSNVRSASTRTLNNLRVGSSKSLASVKGENLRRKRDLKNWGCREKGIASFTLCIIKLWINYNIYFISIKSPKHYSLNIVKSILNKQQQKKLILIAKSIIFFNTKRDLKKKIFFCSHWELGLELIIT